MTYAHTDTPTYHTPNSPTSVPQLGMVIWLLHRWPISSTYLGWKPEWYSFMFRTPFPHKPGKCYPSPGQTTIKVLQLEGLLWSWICGCWLNQDHPLPRPLTSGSHLFIQECCIITALAVYRATQLSLLSCSRWTLTLQEGSSAP